MMLGLGAPVLPVIAVFSEPLDLVAQTGQACFQGLDSAVQLVDRLFQRRRLILEPLPTRLQHPLLILQSSFGFLASPVEQGAHVIVDDFRDLRWQPVAKVSSQARAVW